MSATLVNLIIQLIAGGVGGNAIGAGKRTSISARWETALSEAQCTPSRPALMTGRYLPTNHGFEEFFGNLYHLNAEEEPEVPTFPKNAWSGCSAVPRLRCAELPPLLPDARHAEVVGISASNLGFRCIIRIKQAS